ncbi:MAG: hypothetical protein H6R14_362 [Proteobacteria bacterium]|nr:hypothetical protein [Pseudomonadota bacterium]
MKSTNYRYSSFPRRRESRSFPCAFLVSLLCTSFGRLRGNDGMGGRVEDFNFGHFFRLTVKVGQRGSAA